MCDHDAGGFNGSAINGSGNCPLTGCFGGFQCPAVKATWWGYTYTPSKTKIYAQRTEASQPIESGNRHCLDQYPECLESCGSLANDICQNDCQKARDACEAAASSSTSSTKQWTSADVTGRTNAPNSTNMRPILCLEQELRCSKNCEAIPDKTVCVTECEEQFKRCIGVARSSEAAFSKSFVSTIWVSKRTATPTWSVVSSNNAMACWDTYVLCLANCGSGTNVECRDACTKQFHLCAGATTTLQATITSRPTSTPTQSLARRDDVRTTSIDPNGDAFRLDHECTHCAYKIKFCNDVSCKYLFTLITRLTL